MTGPDNAGYTNEASDGEDSAVQAGVVHDGINVIYQVAPDASPKEIFLAGVRYLDARMLDLAREHIEKAVASGYENDKVRFFRVVALLSGRTVRQLRNSDLDRLLSICAQLPRLDGDGEWTAGLRAVLTLLASLHAADPARVGKELDGLAPRQRNLILDHLGVLLDGPMENEMWRRSVELAHLRRKGGGRDERVWLFFQPKPVPARALPPQPTAYQGADLLRAGLGLVVFLYSVYHVGLSLIRTGDVLPILGLLIAAAGCVALVRYGSEWHFRRGRIQAKDSQLSPRPQSQQAPPHGFARGVDSLFDRYFGRYVPRGTDRDYWIEQTRGVRQQLRDEVVEIYREQRVDAEQLAWLIRHLVGDVRSRYEQGALTSYRQEWQTPHKVVAACLGGIAAIVAGLLLIVAGSSPGGVFWSVIAVVAGTVAVRAGWNIDSERRRFKADTGEFEVRLRTRQDAYARWMRKLEGRPTDDEMAGWLEADRRIMVDEAMRHYQLRAEQIIAHAVIEAPAPGAKRARVKHGPSRYTKYRMVLFLLTEQGVRQVDVRLDFETAEHETNERLNYSFEKVTAARITGLATQRRTFELILVNGDPIVIPVTEAVQEIEPGEDPVKLSQASIDASGLPRTLEVLEGIAAEGKEWVSHQKIRAEKHLADLTDLFGEEPGMA